jgi:hypothetical protein
MGRKNYEGGKTLGTGSAISVELGWKPKIVEMKCQGWTFMWTDDLLDGQCAIMDIGIISAATVDFLLGTSLPTIGTTDTQLANVSAEGIWGDQSTTVPKKTAAVAAGTAFTATTHDITAGKWASFHLTSQHDGTKTITVSAAATYATEAAAIAALAAIPTDEVSLGFCTIQATSAAIFDATTDALAGGSSGTPAEETNYYYGCGIMSGGITPMGDGGLVSPDSYHGFQIGTSSLLNVANRTIFYKAFKN